MGIETNIKSLGVPQTKILEIPISRGGHFEKWPKHVVSPNFFTGNKWNINQTSLLNKMIPPMKDLGGRGAWGVIGARVLLPFERFNQILLRSSYDMLLMSSQRSPMLKKRKGY